MLFRSFSIIDFIIIVLAVVLVIGIFARYDVIGKLFDKTTLTDATITFIAEAVTPEEAEALSEGKVLYLDGSSFGTVLTVAKENAQIYTENESGKLVVKEGTDKLDVSGTVKVKVLKTDGGYLLGGDEFIAAGSTFTVKASGVILNITVLSLTENDR